MLRQLIHWRYADVLFLGVLFILYVVSGFIKPFERQFFVNDLTISHPFAEHERVTNTELFLYSTWIPCVSITVIGLVFTKPESKLYVTFTSLLGLFISVFTTSVVTDILKNFIGRHRPDFLARCIPKADTPKNVMVYAKDVCTTDNLDRLTDGFRTTPSGHSSLAFAGLMYLSLWLSGQLIIKNYQSGAWRSIVCFIPAFCAVLIALSRTEDYRHHFIDVFLGSMLGILISRWSYFRYFPELSHAKSYEPKIIIEIEKKNDEAYAPVEQV